MVLHFTGTGLQTGGGGDLSVHNPDITSRTPTSAGDCFHYLLWMPETSDTREPLYTTYKGAEQRPQEDNFVCGL